MSSCPDYSLSLCWDTRARLAPTHSGPLLLDLHLQLQPDRPVYPYVSCLSSRLTSASASPGGQPTLHEGHRPTS